MNKYTIMDETTFDDSLDLDEEPFDVDPDNVDGESEDVADNEDVENDGEVENDGDDGEDKEGDTLIIEEEKEEEKQIEFKEMKFKFQLKSPIVKNTRNFISKFEYTAIIGLRAQQIAEGSPIYIDIAQFTGRKDKLNPLMIAEMEFEQNKIPLCINRLVPYKKTFVIQTKTTQELQIALPIT